MTRQTSRLDISALPPTLAFLQQHFDRVPRASRGRVMVRCNFPDHQDRTPSMCWNLSTAKWRCFGCGRYGDPLDYLMIRYGWDFKTAARSLGVWREAMTPEQSRELRRRLVQREREQLARAELSTQQRKERFAMRDELHQLEREYSTANTRLSHLRQGAVPRYRGEEHLAWWYLSDTLPRIREAEARYYHLAGLEKHG